MATLLSWLGRTDLDQMKLDKPASIATLALRGPILDSIVILASTWDDEWFDYKDWLKRKLACAGRSKTSVEIKRVRLTSPIDYLSITKVMQKQLSGASSDATQVYINLTSGTPAMTVVSVLLGKGNAKCQFVQTSPQGEINNVDIPVDFASEYAKSSSTAISQLVSKHPKNEGAFSSITAKSAVMQETVKKAQRLAYSDLPALLLGESGTGKRYLQSLFIKPASDSKSHLKPSTVVRYLKTSSIQFYLVTEREPSRELSVIMKDCLSKRTAAHCF